MRIPRKMEHVHHALNLGQTGRQGLSDIKLVPNCLPESSAKLISLQIRIGELNMSSPIFINAMTGGAEETKEINRELAVAARETRLAMAVGSQMSALKNPEVISSYQIVRKVNPTGLVFGNLGSEASLEQAERAVNMLQADALQLHLNVMQELIMPEGDRDFQGMLDRIVRIVEHLGIPVIVKEVGFGMTRESVRLLRQAGVRIIDVGGSGGTNFAAIENERRAFPMEWLNDWGCTTAVSLLEGLHEKYAAEASADDHSSVSFIASGGIRSTMEVCKSLCLGASAVGMAGAFLRTLRSDGTEALIRQISQMQEELRLLMTAMGVDHITGLWNYPVVITGDTAEWCHARGIDILSYANRTRLFKTT